MKFLVLHFLCKNEALLSEGSEGLHSALYVQDLDSFFDIQSPSNIYFILYLLRTNPGEVISGVVTCLPISSLKPYLDKGLHNHAY